MSARGTRTHSAWPPPRAAPSGPNSPKNMPLSQAIGIPRRQSAQLPSEVLNGAMTNWPVRRVVTPAPMSVTIPTNS